MRASASGYMSETVQIQLSPNEVLELNFTLTTTAALQVPLLVRSSTTQQVCQLPMLT
ncbi:hypothetical protein F6Y02_00720 [Bacillus megaterium]|nr:hypothetical protein [Priestia megaterium]